MVLFLFVGASLTLAGCAGIPEADENNPEKNSKLQGSRITVSRKSTDGKSVYALSELEKAAKSLVTQLEALQPGETPRAALSFFTLRDRKSALGESIAQDMATLLADAGRGMIQVFTRRKLYEAARELQYQQSDLFDRETIVQLGKFSGVHYILLGRLEEAAEELRCTCQLLDVETAQIVGGERFKIPLAKIPLECHTLDASVDIITSKLLSSRVDTASRLRVGVFGVTHNKRNFERGTNLLIEVSTELQRAGDLNIQVFTRNDIDKAIEELKLQSSDLFDEASQAQVGRFIGASCVLTGFGEIYRRYYKFNLILLDVESSQILSGAICCVRRK